MNLIDELMSPLVTPFILYFSLRPKAAEIVDFLRNFTIEVSGVGDVCSFAEMNVRKHGQPEWLSEGVTRANQYEQAQLGKTEISLIQFSVSSICYIISVDFKLPSSHVTAQASRVEAE